MAFRFLPKIKPFLLVNQNSIKTPCVRWSFSRCTLFLNPPSEKSSYLFDPPLSISSSSVQKPKWPCKEACTFMNPYHSISCGTRVDADSVRFRCANAATTRKYTVGVEEDEVDAKDAIKAVETSDTVEQEPGKTFSASISKLLKNLTYNVWFADIEMHQRMKALGDFCGDMNWDDKKDGQFPLPDGWVDAWGKMKPEEIGWTYDTKSNKMLKCQQQTAETFGQVCLQLLDFCTSDIKMIGKDAIPNLTWIKVKKVKE